MFDDRRDAGRQLARAVGSLPGGGDAIVLALPRGGVPVAAEVAAALGLPLDVLCVRKLGLPLQPELAMGAVASGGAIVRNDEVLSLLPRATQVFEQVLERESAELARRERAYRGDVPALDIRGRVVVLVDDGLATGATMAAAVHAVRALEARSVIVAVPVAAPESAERIARIADRLVALRTPMLFGSVGQWYGRFDQTADDEVMRLLAASRRRVESGSPPSPC